MTLTKEQRLDWLTYMYLMFMSDPFMYLNWEELWRIVEKGELTGFEYTSYVNYDQFPELKTFGRVCSVTVEKAIHLCEQAKN